jgi:hypothetical protein
LVAAFEATNDSTYLRMAERIADLIIAVMQLQTLGGFLSVLPTPGNRTYAGSPMLRRMAPRLVL